MSNILGKFDLALLKEVLSLPTATYNEDDVQEFIHEYIKRIGDDIIDTETDRLGNIYITKGIPAEDGKYFPCFVAHMDGALDYEDGKRVLRVPKTQLLIGYNTKTNKQCYLAADDLVGVFLALSALRELPYVKVALFVAEEIGCVGSQNAEMEFFKDCGYVLQSDRRGNGDVIYNAAGTIMASKSFRRKITPTMKAFKMSFAQGSITDVMQLKENGLEVSALNISSAYFGPHTDKEYVDVKGLGNIYKFVGALVELLGGDRYQHQYETPVKTSRYGATSYYGYDDWDMSPYRPTNTYTPTLGKTTEQLGIDLLERKLLRNEYVKSHKHNPDYCVQCYYAKQSKNNYLCNECIKDYKEAGIIAPDSLLP